MAGLQIIDRIPVQRRIDAEPIVAQHGPRDVQREAHLRVGFLSVVEVAKSKRRVFGDDHRHVRRPAMHIVDNGAYVRAGIVLMKADEGEIARDDRVVEQQR
jgi:hypothetical protein